MCNVRGMGDSRIGKAVRGSARDSLILMTGRAVSIFVQFLGFIFIARVLGAESFGVVSIAYIPVSLAAILLNIGINEGLVKYLSQYRFTEDEGRRRILIETGATVNLTVGITLTLLTYFSSTLVAENYFKDPAIAPLIQVYSFTLLGQSLVNTANSILIGYEHMTRKSIIDIINSFLRSIAAPILVYMGLGAVGAIMGNVSSTLIAGLLGSIMILVVWRTEPRSTKGFTHRESLQILITYGGSLFLTHLIGGATPRIVNFLLTMHVTQTHIGNYQAATRFGVLVTFFTTSISTVMFPLFSKLEKQVTELRVVFVDSVKYVGLITYPIIAAIISLAPLIITVLYGPDYPHAATYLRLNMLSYCYLGLGSLSIGRLIIVKNTRIVLHRAVISFFTVIPLGLVLIPRYGVTGLITANTVGAIPALIYGLNWVHKTTNITPDYNTALKTILSATISTITTHLYTRTIQLNPWIQLITGGTICITTYLISILLLKTLKPRDIQNLTNIAKGLGPLSKPITLILNQLKQII